MKIFDLILEKKYIGEDEKIAQKIIEIVNDTRYKCIILQSPQGTGKSNFLHSTFDKATYLSPTRMLVEQQKGMYGGEILTGFTSDYIEDETKIIATFASAAKADAAGNKILIVDEAHKIVDYGNFAYSTAISVLSQINNFISENKTVILASATPEPIGTFLNNLPGSPKIVDCLIKIKVKDAKPYLKKLIVVPSDVQFIDYILESQTNQNTGRHVGLIDTTTNLERLTGELESRGINTIGITSRNRTEDCIKPYYDEIVNTGQFSHEILNATSLIDCGINLNASDIEHLYCMPYNIASAKQFLCRARNAMPFGHLQMKSLNPLEKVIIGYSRDILFKKLYRIAVICIRLYRKGLISELALQHIIGVVKISDKCYTVSRLNIWYHIKSLQDRLTLTDLASIELAFDGYFEEIEIYNQAEVIAKRKQQIDEILKDYLGKKLYDHQRKEIKSKMKKIGILYGYFKPFIEDCGYKVESSRNRSWYIITI